MNSIALLITVGLVFEIVQAQEGRNVSKTERFLYDRCRVNSIEASAYDQVKKHHDEFSDYLGYTASLLPNGKEQFCKDERGRLVSLMAQLVKDLKPCFPKNEKYLPKFIYESFVEFLEFVCEGRNMENFFSTQGTECRVMLRRGQAGNEVGNCFKKLFASFDSEVKRDDLCLDLKLAKTCFGDAIARHCQDFAGYESLNNKFFNAVRKPCSSEVTIGISSIVLMVAFVSTKVFS